jgi:hypothetical protein
MITIIGGPSQAIPDVDICPTFHQKLRHGDMTAPSRPMEGSVLTEE